MDGEAPGRHSGTIACAVIGAVALVVCLLVLVLTDDDVGSAAGLGPNAPAQFGGGGDGAAGNGSKSAPGATCKGCEGSTPTKPAGAVPYPPGTHAVHDWTDSFCKGDLPAGETVRAAPMGFAAAKKWYDAHLPAAGYTWGIGSIKHTYQGRLTGYGGLLKTASGSGPWLDIDGGPAPGKREICGAAYGEVYIHVRKE